MAHGDRIVGIIQAELNTRGVADSRLQRRLPYE